MTINLIIDRKIIIKFKVLNIVITIQIFLNTLVSAPLMIQLVHVVDDDIM